MNTRTFEVCAGTLGRTLIDAQLTALRDATPEQLREALAWRIASDQLPPNLFDTLPLGPTQEPCPDDLADGHAVLTTAMDLLGEQDGCCDASRQLLVAIMSNQAARLRARHQWETHCRQQAVLVLDGGAR